MRLIAQPGPRRTGVALGPVAGLVLLIGWLFYAALVATGVALGFLVVAAQWGREWVRGRRRPLQATPQPAAGIEPWARGHREITVAERAIMAQKR